MKAKRFTWSVLPCAAALLGAAVFAAPASAGTPLITHPPRITWPGTGWRGQSATKNSWASSNWSGYAETGSFAGVTGTWTVPTVSAGTAASTFSSTWIGVDGFNDDDLIQTGTEQDFTGGAAHYRVWWEILPAAETLINETVEPGDRMSASIYETTSTATTTGFGFGRHRSTGNVWVISISDTTRGWTFTTDQSYSGPGTSAEWIVEAPEVGGSVATLANYSFTGSGIGTTTGDFDNTGTLASAVASGATPTYAPANLNFTNDAGVMVQNDQQVSTPGQPDSVDTAFNAAYGSTVPPAPTS